ncbi:MAG TPA: hypothetical protein VFF06_32465 [Polyangia bacterium]|nr:hypothetical protein [Polyangia bacterium]
MNRDRRRAPLLSAVLIALAAAASGCSGDAQTSPDLAASVDAGDDAATGCAADAGPHCLAVDDAGVSHGCAPGGMGPGDRDDGGGAPPPPPPDAAADASNLPFGAECLRNDQCTSNVCYFYRVKGTFCTALCNCNADCPPASLGCNGQGVCRVGN